MHLILPIFLSFLILNPVFAENLASAKSAPDFSLESEEGVVSLADLQGKVVYLDFWASWCAPCRASFPWMNELQAKFAAQDFVVVAVNLDESRKDAKRFLERYPADFTVLFDEDGRSAAAYQVLGMPSSYVINREGQIVYQHVGFRANDVAELERQIAAAL